MKFRDIAPQSSPPSGFKPTHPAAIQVMVDHAISTNPDAVTYWDKFFKNREKIRASDDQ